MKVVTSFCFSKEHISLKEILNRSGSLMESIADKTNDQFIYLHTGATKPGVFRQYVKHE